MTEEQSQSAKPNSAKVTEMQAAPLAMKSGYSNLL